MNTSRKVFGLVAIGVVVVVCLVGVVLLVPRALGFWTFGSVADGTLSAGAAAAKIANEDFTKTDIVPIRAASLDGTLQSGVSVVEQTEVQSPIPCVASAFSIDDGLLQCGFPRYRWLVCYPGPKDQQPPVAYCMDDLEDTALKIVPVEQHYSGLQASANPAPWRIALETGATCRPRLAAPAGTAADGRYESYFCDNDAGYVLELPDDGRKSGIDMSGDIWTAQIGDIGTSNHDELPPPETVRIKTVYFGGILK